MIRKVLIVGAALCAALSASPAMAGRGIQIDVTANPAPVCDLNDTECSNALSLSDIGYNQGALANVFIYREGVISFGAPLGLSSATFSVAQSSKQFDVYAGYTSFFDDDGIENFVDLISFFEPGSTVVPGESMPLFQYSLYNFPDSGVLQLGYAHLGAPAGATIGYNVAGQSNSVTNANGLVLGEAESASTFVFNLTNGESVGLDSFTFNPVGIVPPVDPIGAVPEPSTWAMLLLGFGIIGGTLRSRRRRLPAMA